MRQPDLFGETKVAKPVNRNAAPKRKLMRTLRAAPKGGLVNGMSKAQLRRYAPEKLPRVTVHD